MSSSASKKQSGRAAREASSWSLAGRIVASGLIAFHVFAVFVAPWSNPGPSSDLSRWFADRIQPYLRAVAIDNGYRFFAPDPGPSHLVRYEIDFADGTTRDWVFPDPHRHWPRLWYHRQFMLSERMANMYGELQSIPPVEQLSPPELQMAQAMQARTEVLKSAVARYLMAQHDGSQRIRLFIRTHAIPSPEEIAAGVRLEDESLYEEFPFGEYRGGTP